MWPPKLEPKANLISEYDAAVDFGVAYIARMWKDARGAPVKEYASREKLQAYRMEAVRFFQEGGGFYDWCDMIGISDPCGMLAELERREKANGTG